MKTHRTATSGRIAVVVRCAAALAATAGVTTGLAGLALAAVAPVAARLRTDGPGAALALPLADVLAALAAVGVLLCWAALAVEGAAFATGLTWQVLRHGRLPTLTAGPAAGAHRWPRRAALAALGLSVGAGALAPALAAPPGRPGPETVVAAAGPLAGLPLPDRTPGPATPTTPTRTVTVRPGDSLWSIAGSLAGAQASPGSVAACWQRLLDADADRLGADPDLIFPGTSLRAPRCDRPRKDRP